MRRTKPLQPKPSRDRKGVGNAAPGMKQTGTTRSAVAYPLGTGGVMVPAPAFLYALCSVKKLISALVLAVAFAGLSQAAPVVKPNATVRLPDAQIERTIRA